MDRTPIAGDGGEKIVCKNTGWNKIGYDRADDERLWAMLSTLNSLIENATVNDMVKSNGIASLTA